MFCCCCCCGYCLTRKFRPSDFPWWLSQEQNRPSGTPERKRLLAETGFSEAELGAGTPLLTHEAFACVPGDVRPLVQHWVLTEHDGVEAAKL